MPVRRNYGVMLLSVATPIVILVAYVAFVLCYGPQLVDAELCSALDSPSALDCIVSGYEQFGIPEGTHFAIRDRDTIQDFVDAFSNRDSAALMPPGLVATRQSVNVDIVRNDGRVFAVRFYGESCVANRFGWWFIMRDPDGGPRTVVLEKWLQERSPASP